MANIKQAVKDMLLKLATIAMPNNEGQFTSSTVRVWNNQLSYLRDGKLEGFVLPALCLEVVNQARYQVIGQGFRSADLSFRIHILHQFYNQDGTYEQDLDVFDIRDNLLAQITMFRPAGCGPLTCIAEDQDYSHDNIYHYIMDFVANFTDSKASPDDPESGKFVPSVPPLTLETEIDLETSITQPPYTGPFKIPSR